MKQDGPSARRNRLGFLEVYVSFNLSITIAITMRRNYVDLIVLLEHIWWGLLIMGLVIAKSSRIHLSKGLAWGVL